MIDVKNGRPALAPFLNCTLLALAVFALGTTPARADVKDGVDAWSAGDYGTAIRQWQAPADRGDPDALFNLAQAYKLGRGVPMDLARAEDLYGKAAAKGHLQAADSYGLLLFQRGERARALPYIEASAARGDARAQYILGVAHFNGDIVAKDWVRAYALTSLARQAGLSQAANALVQMDQHIPLEDRQKSVLLATRIAADADAARQRLATSSELGTTLAAADPAPEAAEARSAATQAARVAATAVPANDSPANESPAYDSPASAGADYARPATKPPAPAARPAPVRPSPAPARIAAAPRPEVAKAAAKPAPAAPAASGPWRVQLGAFGVVGNAEALWAKVRGRPELAGHARVLAPAGKLTKLQASGFATKAAADAACARLSAGGFGCLSVRD